MKYYLIATLAALALTACADDTKDYDAMATCGGEGLKPGTAEYDHCVYQEKAAHQMEQQHQEYDQMKQQQQDWTLRRY